MCPYKEDKITHTLRQSNFKLLPRQTRHTSHNYIITHFIITAAIIQLLSESCSTTDIRQSAHLRWPKKEEEKRSGVFWSSSALVYISIMTDDKVEVRPFMRTALITHPDAQANESHLWLSASQKSYCIFSMSILESELTIMA